MDLFKYLCLFLLLLLRADKVRYINIENNTDLFVLIGTVLDIGLDGIGCSIFFGMNGTVEYRPLFNESFFHFLYFLKAHLFVDIQNIHLQHLFFCIAEFLQGGTVDIEVVVGLFFDNIDLIGGIFYNRGKLFIVCPEFDLLSNIECCSDKCRRLSLAVKKDFTVDEDGNDLPVSTFCPNLYSFDLSVKCFIECFLDDGSVLLQYHGDESIECRPCCFRIKSVDTVALLRPVRLFGYKVYLPASEVPYLLRPP